MLVMFMAMKLLELQIAARRDGRRHARLLPAAHPLLLFAKHPDRPLAAVCPVAGHRHPDPPAWRAGQHPGQPCAMPPACACRRSPSCSSSTCSSRASPARSGACRGCPRRDDRLVGHHVAGQHFPAGAEWRHRLSRARFEHHPTAKQKLYWRGPVMEQFDGTTWRPRQPGTPRPPQLETLSPPVSYETTLEPHNQRWLLALDAPVQLPEGPSKSTS
jgi:hypothetical protein